MVFELFRRLGRLFIQAVSVRIESAGNSMSGKWFSILCCALVALVVGTSVVAVMLESSQGGVAPSLVLMTSGSDDRQDAVVRGAEAAAKELGIELAVEQLAGRLPPSDAESACDRSINSAAGVVVYQTRNRPSRDAIRDLADKAHVITCGEDVWPEHRLCNIGTGDYSAGRICASMIGKSLPAGGRIVVLVDIATEGAGAVRLKGFREALSASAAGVQQHERSPRLEICECYQDYGHAGLCVRNLRLATTRHPDAVCVVDLGSRTERSTVAPLASMARAAGMKLITFERSDAALVAVEAGEAFALIGDDPFAEGYQAVCRLASFSREGPMSLPVAGRGSVNLPACVVRADTASAYREKLLMGRSIPAA
jgi:ABC-type sugar transport system substrate-binding protein